MDEKGGVFVNEFSIVLATYFANITWLLAAIALAIVGYFRVKRERRQLVYRIAPATREVKEGMVGALGIGLLASLLFVATGVVFAPYLLVVMSIVSVACLLTFYWGRLSPVYVAILALVLVFTLPAPDGVIFQTYEMESVTMEHAIISFAVFVSIALLIESMLIGRLTTKNSSPSLVKTKRGGWIGRFHTKQAWVVPLFFLVPGEWFESFTYWPRFTFGETSFAIFAMPFVIGYSRYWYATYPEFGLAKEKKRVLQLAVIVSLFTACTLIHPYFSYGALAVALIGRLVIHWSVRKKETGDFAFAKPKSEGMLIVGVLEGTPAEEMGLQIGEVIQRVNDRDVSSEKEFYNALQQNAAHCRLQVIDRNGEVRLMQQVVYADDHYKLGLLFMPK